MNDPLSLTVTGLRDLAWMELPGHELRPELPRAIPMTQKCNGIYYLVGLIFATPEDAERFATGLEAFCDREGARLFLKKPPTIIQDPRGNCSGVN